MTRHLLSALWTRPSRIQRVEGGIRTVKISWHWLCLPSWISSRFSFSNFRAGWRMTVGNPGTKLMHPLFLPSNSLEQLGDVGGLLLQLAEFLRSTPAILTEEEKP